MQRLLPIIMLFLLFNLTACKLIKSEPVGLPDGVRLEDKYYTQVTIQYEKGKFRTTNYRRGPLLAVNTEVKLLEVTPKFIKVMLIQREKELLIVNAAKHTGDDVYQAFDKLLAKQPVELSKFSRLERKNIDVAKAGKGMTQAAVLVAIGYPPIIRTPSLDSDKWTYWSGRFNTFIVHFEKGKVARIQD